MSLIIFIVALLVRLAFYALYLRFNPCMLMYDSGHYHTMAQHLLQYGGFMDAHGLIDTYRLPGYPLFLSACYQFTGVIPQGALWVQLILGSLIPVLIYYLALRITDSLRVALIAAMVSCLHVGLVLFAGLVMTETIFGVLFLLFLYVLLGAQTSRNFLVAGLLLGLCNLIRPLAFLPLAVVGALMSFETATTSLPQDERHWRFALILRSLSRQAKSVSKDMSAFKPPIAFLLGWSLPPALWVLRNFLHTGMLLLHTFNGPHLLNHAAVRVYALAHHTSHQQAQQQVYAQLPSTHESDPNRQQMVVSQQQEAQTIKILLRYPLQTMLLGAINCFKTVCSLYSSELLCIDSGGQLPSYDDSLNLGGRLKRLLCPEVTTGWLRVLIWYEILMHLLLLLGAAGFVVQRLRQRTLSRTLVLLLLISVVCVAQTAACGFARLRLPIEPILIMVAVMFYTSRVSNKGKRA